MVAGKLRAKWTHHVVVEVRGGSLEGDEPLDIVPHKPKRALRLAGAGAVERGLVCVVPAVPVRAAGGGRRELELIKADDQLWCAVDRSEGSAHARAPADVPGRGGMVAACHI